MSFAAPAALLLSALAAPIVLLYLLKQRRRHVEVSSLLFWDQILQDEHSVASWTRLRKLLSLLLQLLFLALIVLALARPVFSKDMLGARRMVLLLDASASMGVREGDESRFDQALRLAGDVIDGMSMGDDLMLAVVADGVDVVEPFTSLRKDLKEALEELDEPAGATDFADAAELIQSLPPDERKTFVYVISDGAFSEVNLNAPEDVYFAYLPVGEAKENVGVTAFQLRPLPASARDFEMLAEVFNATDEEIAAPWELYVGDNLIDVGELTIAPGERLRHSLRQFSRAGGPVRFHVDFEDAFPEDNTAYALLPEADPVGVLLVTEGNMFLETALLTNDGIVLETVAPAEYAPRLEGDAPDLTIFDRRAPREAPAGHAVYISAWPEQAGASVAGALDNPIVTDWDREHPINRHLNLKNVRIDSALQMTPPEGSHVLIESFGHPLAALHEEGGVKSLFIGFDAIRSDLPLRIAFPILVANAAEYMVRGEREDLWESADVGAVMAFDALAGRMSRREKRAVAAVVEPLSAEGSPEATAREWRPGEVVPISRPGIYGGRFEDGEEAPLLAANLADAEESAIAPAEALPFSQEGGLREVVEGRRLGVEPWYFLTLLGFALVAAEWALFHRRIIE
jgi:hypothetical protein